MFVEFVPRDIQESLSRASWFRWATIALLLCIGPLLVYKGWVGIKTKTVTSKGREYTGLAAVVIGGLWVLMGAAMAGGAILLAIQLFKRVD